MIKTVFLCMFCATVICGCATSARQDLDTVEISQPDTNLAVSQRRVFSEKQLDTLRSFALTESPQLWQAVQSIKAEKAVRQASLTALCKEMEEFGRDPESDPDVAALRAAEKDLEESLSTIYEKLEAAYIAYKKMQATPGKKEYNDLMRSALEDGVLEAESTAARYKEMSQRK